MNLKRVLPSLVAGAALAFAAPAFATQGQHIGHVFLTPVACDEESELYPQGGYAQWVHIPHSHFAGVTVGMTNPNDDFDVSVGDRLDGGTQGVPFGPAKTFKFKQTYSGALYQNYSVVFNIPNYGVFLLLSGGDNNGMTTVNNADGSFTVTGNYTNSFPTGTTFVGIYINDFNGDSSFTSTVTNACVDGVTAAPNMHTGRKATNGFVLDCNGYGFEPSP